MKRTLLTAAGRDRPGLVAAVTTVLFQEHCNLEDSAMTRLQGEFAILLIFTGPAKPAGLERKLKALGKRLGLSIHLKPLSDRESRAPARTGDRVLITVYGADRPGIVHRVTTLLAKARVNLSDLSTHRTEPAGKASGYILYLEGEAPAHLSPETLEKALRKSVAEMDVTVSVKPLPNQAL